MMRHPKYAGPLGQERGRAVRKLAGTVLKTAAPELGFADEVAGTLSQSGAPWWLSVLAFGVGFYFLMRRK